MICGIHSHDMCCNLVGHPIARRLNNEEKEIISNMTLNTVKPKNILATLKGNELIISQISSKSTIFMPK